MSIPLPSTTVLPLATTDPPTTTAPPPASTTALPPASSVSSAMVPTSSLPMGAPAAPRVIITPEQTTAAIVDLSHGMAEMRLTLQSILQYLQPPMPAYAAPPQPFLPPSQQMLLISYPYGLLTDARPSSSTSTPLPSTNVPIHMIRFPPSPSQIPTWAMGQSGPVYTTAPSWTHVPVPPSTGAVMDHGGPVVSGTLYGGMDGTLFHGSSVLPTATSAPISNYSTLEGGAPAAAQGSMPPKFHKLEFTTYEQKTPGAENYC